MLSVIKPNILPQLTDDRSNKLLVIVVLLLRTESDCSGPDAVDTT